MAIGFCVEEPLCRSCVHKHSSLLWIDLHVRCMRKPFFLCCSTAVDKVHVLESGRPKMQKGKTAIAR